MGQTGCMTGQRCEVEIPPELAAALASDPVAASAFEALSYTHRREYARWVAEAKRDSTRADRAARSVERLRAGVAAPSTPQP